MKFYAILENACQEHIKIKLNTHEKVENIVDTIFVVSEFEKFESTLITEYKPSNETQEQIDSLKDTDSKNIDKEDIEIILKV